MGTLKKITFLLLIMIILLITNKAQAESQFKGDLWILFNYLRLQKELYKYQYIEDNGGWPSLAYNTLLKRGDIDREVLRLKERLYISGDLSDYDDSELFDTKLEKALKKFQYRHGIKQDGVLGPETMVELNIPVSRRIEQLKINKEKIYNLFDKHIDRYVLVNIPAYHLKVIEEGKEILSMKAIVGKKERQTPIFKDQIEYLVLNPSWRIPIKKVVKDIIPMINKYPNYLEYKNINVFDGWGDDAKELSPDKIEWNQYNLNNFDLMLEQEPGPKNELGRVKFMFPNKHLVYIHDTPDKDLFDYMKRTFSSGCIRVERPLELAFYCLKDLPGWNWEKIMQIIEEGKQLEIELNKPIPVIIVYWTAWVDENNNLHFRNDIYDHYSSETLDENIQGQ